MPTFTKLSKLAEEHILLPSSSEDEEDLSQTDLSDVDHDIDDPFHSNDDSDDAPEAFSFKSAQENLLFQKEQTREIIRTHNEEKRRKRKELHEQYLAQKEEKKRKIKDKMLPEEILQNLSDGLKTRLESEKEMIEAENNEDLNDTKAVKELTEEIGPTIFKCKILSEEDKRPRYIPEEVLSFKDKLLYGGRIRRERSAHHASLKKEKQAVKRRRL